MRTSLTITKSNIRKPLLIATAILGLCGICEARASQVVNAPSWLPANLEVAAVNDEAADAQGIQEGTLAAEIIDRGAGADITDLTIINPSFEMGGLYGWRVIGDLTAGDYAGDIFVKRVTSNPISIMTDVNGEYFYSTYARGTGNTLRQTLYRLPAGRYVLSAQMGPQPNGGVMRYLHLSAGDYTVSVPAVSENENHRIELEFLVGTDPNIEISAWASYGKDATLDDDDKAWFEVDDFRLTYLDDYDMIKLNDVLASLDKNHIGFKEGEYSPYSNQEMIKAYVEAKKLVNSVNPDFTKAHEYLDVLLASDKWKKQTTQVNAFYNPHFWLIREGMYEELVGWSIKDNTFTGDEEKWLKTGGKFATCATANQYWTKFANTEGSVNLNGEQNAFSTAATFKFSEKNKFCSSNSVYSYGDSTGFEMPLDPEQTYTFSAQIGYYVDGEKGSATFEIVNARTNEVVMSEIITPNVCVSDTISIPETFQFTFETKKSNQLGYDNTLDNWDNLEMYKLVVRNTDPDNYWSMVMSNLSLYRNGTNAEEPSDTIRVDIAESVTIDTDNSKTTVKVDDDGNKYCVYESLDESKGVVVTFNIPMGVMVKGEKYYVVVVLNPFAKSRPVHLQLGLKGISSRLMDRPSSPEADENSVMNVLGEYVYSGDKVETLVYEFTATEDLQNPKIQLSTEASSENDYETSVALKDIYLLPTASATGIEVTRQTKVSAPEGIFTIEGVKVSSFQKGINVVRFSNGLVRKILY